MKFVIAREELAGLIRKIQNVVPQNAPLPILSHFLIEACDGELVLTATDLTVGRRLHSTLAHVYQEGSLSLPSRRFFQLMRELTEPNIELSVGEQEMAQIKAGSSFFRLHGMSKNEYPELPDLSEAMQFQIEGSVLYEMLSRTAFAVSKEDNRFVLTGVLMRIKDGKAIFVGTDGKRLAKNETDILLTEDYSGEFIIPIKAVDEILKTIEPTQDARIYLTADKIAVESGNGLLVSKLLTGSYPDFEQVIGTRGEHRMTLHREELITLLRQISLFTADNSHSVRFSFQPGELVLTANTAEVGDGKVSMPVNHEGPAIDIAFNPHFFLDILRHCEDETVDLDLSDAFNPGIVTDSTRALFIIMPMRLGDES